MLERRLTPKQEAFVREYLVDLNATDAARRAGYSPRTAHSIGPRLLKELAAEIAAAKDVRAERTELTQDWVVDQLRTVVERCLQAEPVRDSQGIPTGEFRFDSKGANTALGLLGKHLGMFASKLQVEPGKGGPVLFELRWADDSPEEP